MSCVVKCCKNRSDRKKKIQESYFIERSHTDLYNELEVANLECFKSTKQRSNKNILNEYEKNLPDKDANSKSATFITFENKYKTRGDVIFHRNMRVLILYGQFLGLNPVSGILGDDTSKLRFNFFSCQVLYSVFLLIFQMAYFMLHWRKMFEGPMTISTMGGVAFYGATTAATCIFLRVAMKWPSLVRDVAASKLEEYMNPRIRRKCNIATVVMMSLAIVEQSFVLIARITTILDCDHPDSKEDIFPVHTQSYFKLFFDLGIQYNTAVGILFQVCNIITVLKWNFPDMFIICMSCYLSSILEMINKKVVAAKGTQTSLEFWKSMREDYSRATKLVRKFDVVISGVIFTSFADSLFFICLQLFNVLSNNLSSIVMDNHQCPNYPSGPFHGYEHQIYMYYSFCHVFLRAILVSLFAANVHSASIMVAPALYELPPSVYCEEVQRFIDQVHNDKVALSGLQFFYVTKGLLLSVGATIVTYELVLLQFNDYKMMNKV